MPGCGQETSAGEFPFLLRYVNPTCSNANTVKELAESGTGPVPARDPRVPKLFLGVPCLFLIGSRIAEFNVLKKCSYDGAVTVRK